MSSQHIRLSQNLIAARQSCTLLDTYPGAVPETPEEAYQVQDLCIAGWKDELVGWKVAGLKADLHEQFKASRQSGPVFKKTLQWSSGDDYIYAPVFAGGFAAIEAEFVIELGDVSSLPSSNLTIEDALNAIAKIYIGIEIASSPMKHPGSYGTLASVSDFGSNAGVIIGPEISNWRDLEFSDIEVSVKIGEEVVGTANAKPGLSGPLGAVTYLIEHLAGRGHGITAGTYVSSGAITGVHQAEVGVPSEVVFSGLGSIDLELVARESCVANTKTR